MSDIYAKRGDTVEFDVYVTKGGQPTDLQGATAQFMLKRAFTDADIDALFAGGATIPAPTTDGKISVKVPPTATSGLNNDNLRLVWEVQVSSGSDRWTVESGNWIQSPEVIRG